jgi:hypothetical protein
MSLPKNQRVVKEVMACKCPVVAINGNEPSLKCCMKSEMLLEA